MLPPPIVLASASPRRRELLAILGVQARIVPADVDERVLPGEGAEALVARLAGDKARAVAEHCARDPIDRDHAPLVIGADTVVVIDGEILGKPTGPREARAFIERLAGRSHLVLTGHCLRRGDGSASRVVSTVVTFRELDELDVQSYLASGEGEDKAGGYAIQGRGAGLVAAIEGCYSNVVGLSLPTVIALARSLGVRLA